MNCWMQIAIVTILCFSLLVQVSCFAQNNSMSESPQKKQKLDPVADEESENLKPWAERVSSTLQLDFIWDLPLITDTSLFNI